MPVESGKVISIHYTLRGDDGEIIDTSDGREPLDYLHGADNIVPGLEKALGGKEEGDKVSVAVSPTEGYGERDDSLKVEVPKKHFEAAGDIQPGVAFQANLGSGMRVFTVTGVTEDTVSADGNHPLAGQPLNFDVEIVGIRDASEEEKEHGHVHPKSKGGGGSCGEGCGCH